jgi:hypothetical protein
VKAFSGGAGKIGGLKASPANRFAKSGIVADLDAAASARIREDP